MTAPEQAEVYTLLTEMSAQLDTLRQQVARQQTRLAELGEFHRCASQTALGQEVVSRTTRRRALRRLAAGLLAGVSAAGTVGMALPTEAQAKFVASKGAGAIVMLANGSVTGNLPANAIYGLIATPDDTLDLSGIPAGVKAGMLAYSTQAGVIGLYSKTSSGNAIIAASTEGNGVNGYSTNNNGLYGYSSGSGNGVYGSASSTGKGVYGQSNSGVGVYGQSTSNTGVYGTSGAGYGVQGNCSSGFGVYGASGKGIGVYGTSGFAGLYGEGVVYGVHGRTTAGDDSGIGVYGQAPTYGYGVYGDTRSGFGVYGNSTYGVGSYGQGPIGVQGVAVNASGRYSAGVYGYASGTEIAVGIRGIGLAGSPAGEFSGTVGVYGSFYASEKNFKIDHPLDPANQYLLHSCVESCERKNIYDGIVKLDEKGQATIQLPKWFESLNVEFRYQLCPLGQPCPTLHIAQELNNGQFQIGGGTAGLKVSWQLTGIRNDPFARQNPLQVEETKLAHEQGLYIHPELYGQSQEKALSYRWHKAAEERPGTGKPK